MSFIMQHPISSIYIFGVLAGFLGSFALSLREFRIGELRYPNGSPGIAGAGIVGISCLFFGVIWPAFFILGIVVALVYAWSAPFWLVFKLAKKGGGDGGA